MDRRSFIALTSGLLVPRAVAALGLSNNEELAALFGRFPFPTAVADFDFQRRIYFWGALSRQTAAFTAFTLGSGTLTQYGLLPASDTVITVTSAAIGISSPGTMMARLLPTGIPAANVRPVELHDGTSTNRLSINQNASGNHQAVVLTANVSEASVGRLATLNQRNGIAWSWKTNSVKAVLSNTAIDPLRLGPEDTAVNIPTVTTLQLGKGQAGNQYSGYLQRVVLLNTALDYPDLGRYAMGIIL